MSCTKGGSVFYGIDNISEKLDGIIKIIKFKKTVF